MKNFCLNCNKDNYTYVKKRKGKLIEVCTKCNNEINTYCEECKENTKNIIDYLSTGGYQIICEKCHQIKKVDKYKPKNDTQKINTKETDDTPYETPESLKKRREELLKQKRASLPQYQDINTPRCPKCGSTAIQPAQKGFSFLTGFVG